jgi:hypothetical protein
LFFKLNRKAFIVRCNVSVSGDIISLLDLFRQEYVKGKVIDKYSLSNGNVGLIISDDNSHKRYHVEFRDGYKGPGVENLFGLVKEPFSNKTEYLDRLIDEDDSVELTVSYSKGPFRQAYRIHSVSSQPVYREPGKATNLPQRYLGLARY